MVSIVGVQNSMDDDLNHMQFCFKMLNRPAIYENWQKKGHSRAGVKQQ